MKLRRISFAALLVAAALIPNPGLASAHTTLQSSEPAAGSVLQKLPDFVRLTFVGPLLDLAGAPDANQIVVSDNSGGSLTEAAPVIDENIITVALKNSPASGQISVAYRVVSSDGHPIQGSFEFTVGEVNPTETQTPKSTPISTHVTDWTLIYVLIWGAIFLVTLAYLARKRKRSR